MRVTHQTKLRLEVSKIFFSDTGRYEVFLDRLSRAAAHQSKNTFLGNVNFADGYPIMIPDDTDVVGLTQARNALIRFRAVADNISQAPDIFHSPLPCLSILSSTIVKTARLA